MDVVNHTKRTPRTRGAILASAGILMLTLVAMAVVGVDIGRVAVTANETQTVADVAASAYARAMLTNEMGGSRDATADAIAVVQGNSVAGEAASAGNVSSLVEGSWSWETRSFVPAGSPVNAVQATATATIDNIFADIFGDGQSTATKQAIAAIGCPSSARAVLPIAVGECEFEAFQSSGDCSDLPNLRQQNPGADNSCWTSLSSDANTNAALTRAMLPAECGCNGCGEASPSPVGVGDDVDLQEGQTTTVMHALEDCLRNGIDEFVIPVIGCDETGATGCHNGEVRGFAAVRISNIVSQGNPKTLDLEFFCDSQGAGGGGTCAGLQTVAMVQ